MKNYKNILLFSFTIFLGFTNLMGYPTEEEDGYTTPTENTIPQQQQQVPSRPVKAIRYKRLSSQQINQLRRLSQMYFPANNVEQGLIAQVNNITLNENQENQDPQQG